MRTVISGLIFVGFFLLCFFFGSVGIVSAECSGCETNSANNVTICTTCTNPDGNQNFNVQCGPGTYPCSTGCCPTAGSGATGCTGCGCWCGCGFTGCTGSKNAECIAAGDCEPWDGAHCYIQPYPNTCACSHPVTNDATGCAYGYIHGPDYEDDISCGSFGWDYGDIYDQDKNNGNKVCGQSCTSCKGDTTGDCVVECEATKWRAIRRDCVPDPNYVACTLCAATAPSAPSLSLPAVGAVVSAPSGSQTVNFSWNATTNWSEECSATANRSYNLCVGTNSTDPCTGGGSYTTSDPSSPATAYSASVSTVGNNYWNVKATNKGGATSLSSEVRSFCVEGFNVTNTAYVSNWSVCDANHKHTRTCREDCGTDNCAATPLIEDCQGAIRGTIFDASDYNSCPAFDPTSGYITGLPAGVGAPSRSFGLTDASSVAPHPWSTITSPLTNAIGNYSVRVYAPANYTYNFSSLSDIYVTSGGPKLVCTSSVASVPSNPVTCQTQPCSLLNNMSFGFWKIYGGWWQAVGGNVHGDGGIKSAIPSSLLTEMSLILPDTTEGNRLGFLSYGVPRAADMLGTNPNAKVSNKLWEKESQYDGQIYDWNFYDKRFNLFETTAWDGVTVNYNDNGFGYQIFKSGSAVTDFGYSPTGTEKVIFHVNGDVRVTSNITVPDGAFLAVISSGTITFDQSVTRADGWYIANSISVPCEDVDGNGCDKTDSQFLGNGTFIGWGGISLTRNRGMNNNTAPSEKFTYRQDIYLNAPKPMKIYKRYFKPFVP